MEKQQQAAKAFPCKQVYNATLQEDLLREYITEIGTKCKNNWAMPVRFVGQDLEAIIFFKVHPDGSLTDIYFDKRSGSTDYDGSVEKAVKKSNPVCPFPENLEKTPIEMAIRFQPPNK
ncbi:energy transducer TonB [Desulfatibacillum aliphaticivorans]|uniref:energy transducer TonB n=1 Tax=Desulfatibacillum aliphaticivorans TaxID=218208 RepID=UPI00143B5B7D|nr:energy transducer TonB [Desulfatibacillum aliphaticivorans]